jgi:SAM-dependent methyltransferase
VGTGGTVVGLDPNEEMLAVARRRSARVEWRSGRAESLPFADASFDRVVSQFGFMFFSDRPAALREMVRVLRPNGQRVADAFRAPFALGDPRMLLSFCAEAGIHDAQVVRSDGTVRFGSIASLVSTERACVWTLGGLLDDDQFDRLLAESEESLRPFTASDGAVAFVMPALIVTAGKA